MDNTGIRVVPKTEGGDLQGFVVKGRRPDNILEWAHTTLALAHFAVSSEYSIFRQPTFLALHDDPFRLLEDTLIDVPVVEVGLENVDRETFGAFALGAAVVRVEKELAIGALLFPGAPHIGIGHVASVVHIDVEGTVHKMFTDDNASTTADPDIAVLSSLLLSEY